MSTPSDTTRPRRFPGRPRLPSYRLAGVLALVLGTLLLAQSPAAAADVRLYDGASYEVFSVPGAEGTAAGRAKPLLQETPRNALNQDGLLGYFVSETADKLTPGRMFAGARYQYRELNSRYGVAYKGNDKGTVSSLLLSFNYIGDWAEWAVTVPVHRWDLAAPRTFNTTADENEGVGNLRLGWKATYLPDRSYYRFAYGATAYVTTGNPDRMLPAGSRREDELKLYGCVTTRESDAAVLNLQLGAILNSENTDDRFIYGLALSYEASAHATLIGELVGEIQGGDDKDTMDAVIGLRLAPTVHSVLEFAYTRNLRTYRAYGWDEQLQTGFTIRW